MKTSLSLSLPPPPTQYAPHPSKFFLSSLPSLWSHRRERIIRTSRSPSGEKSPVPLCLLQPSAQASYSTRIRPPASQTHPPCFVSKHEHRLCASAPARRATFGSAVQRPHTRHTFSAYRRAVMGLVAKPAQSSHLVESAATPPTSLQSPRQTLICLHLIQLLHSHPLAGNCGSRPMSPCRDARASKKHASHVRRLSPSFQVVLLIPARC